MSKRASRLLSGILPARLSRSIDPNQSVGAGDNHDLLRPSTPIYSSRRMSHSDSFPGSSNGHDSAITDSPNATQRVEHNNPNTGIDILEPPNRPFGDKARERKDSGSNLSFKSDKPASFFSTSRLDPLSYGSDTPRGSGSQTPMKEYKDRPISLSVNYVPAKFTKLHHPSEEHKLRLRRRKDGGGRSAWGDDANRMGMVGLVDDDGGVEYKMARGGVKRKGKRGLRWNRFKWTLFVANTVLLIYGLATLVSAILVWLNVFLGSDVIRVGNTNELIVSTVAAAMCTFTAILGYSGIILNNRAFLAVYTLLLWIDLAFIAAPGYMTYKQRTFNLEGKLNYQWSRNLGSLGRLRIQDALDCCGYFSPFIEATQSPLCYSRSNFPGCKGAYLRLERKVLDVWYITAFSIVPAHILIIISALLCSNHVTYRFGKGLTPKAYRLDLRSMGVIMDDYANQIAAQYGTDMAHEVLTNSLSRTDSSLPGGAAGSSTLHQTSSNSSSQAQSPFDDFNNGQSTQRPQSQQNQYLQPGHATTRRPSLGAPLHSASTGSGTSGIIPPGNIDFTVPSNRNSFTDVNAGRRSRPNSGQFDSVIGTVGTSTAMGRTGSFDSMRREGSGKPLWDPRRDSMDSVKFAALMNSGGDASQSGRPPSAYNLPSATGQAGSGGIRLVNQNTGGSERAGGNGPSTPNLNASNQKRMSGGGGGGGDDRFQDADSPMSKPIDLDRMEVSTGYGSDQGTVQGGSGSSHVRNSVGWAA